MRVSLFHLTHKKYIINPTKTHSSKSILSHPVKSLFSWLCTQVKAQSHIQFAKKGTWLYNIMNDFELILQCLTKQPLSSQGISCSFLPHPIALLQDYYHYQMDKRENSHREYNKYMTFVMYSHQITTLKNCLRMMSSGSWVGETQKWTLEGNERMSMSQR